MDLDILEVGWLPQMGLEGCSWGRGSATYYLLLLWSSVLMEADVVPLVLNLSIMIGHILHFLPFSRPRLLIM